MAETFYSPPPESERKPLEFNDVIEMVNIPDTRLYNRVYASIDWQNKAWPLVLQNPGEFTEWIFTCMHHDPFSPRIAAGFLTPVLVETPDTFLDHYHTLDSLPDNQVQLRNFYATLGQLLVSDDQVISGSAKQAVLARVMDSTDPRHLPRSLWSHWLQLINKITFPDRRLPAGDWSYFKTKDKLDFDYMKVPEWIEPLKPRLAADTLSQFDALPLTAGVLLTHSAFAGTVPQVAAIPEVKAAYLPAMRRIIDTLPEVDQDSVYWDLKTSKYILQLLPRIIDRLPPEPAYASAALEWLTRLKSEFIGSFDEAIMDVVTLEKMLAAVKRLVTITPGWLPSTQELVDFNEMRLSLTYHPDWRARQWFPPKKSDTYKAVFSDAAKNYYAILSRVGTNKNEAEAKLNQKIQAYKTGGGEAAQAEIVHDYDSWFQTTVGLLKCALARKPERVLRFRGNDPPLWIREIKKMYAYCDHGNLSMKHYKAVEKVQQFISKFYPDINDYFQLVTKYLPQSSIEP